MKKYEKGQYIEMTADEIQDVRQGEEVDVQQTVEERLAVLEALLLKKEGV